MRIRYHQLFFFLVLILLTLGVLFVFDASVAEAYQQFNDKFYFARQQLVWAGFGLSAMFISSYIPMKWFRFIGPIVFFGSLTMLVGVLIPGIGAKVQGARRWLILGPFRMQPAELMKTGLILYFSSWLSTHQRFWPFLLLIGLIFSLIMLQPDLGSALVVTSIGIGLFIAAGGKWLHLSIIASIGVVGIILLIVTSPYRMNRVKTFFNQEGDPLGASYQIRQITIALGSGGLFGQGIGQSRQKYQYIPEASTDSIFAIAAEEIGFIGTSVILVIFLSLLLVGFRIAQQSSDPYTRLVAIGCVIWIGTQTAINLGSIVSLIPLTGVPLPYISYGGSSLLSILAASGILMGIGRRSS